MGNEERNILVTGDLLIYHCSYNLLRMTTAKIIRHRHKFHHYINDDLKAVSEDVHFKIIFSDPEELDKFEQWCIKNKGKYDYNKEENKQYGKTPKLKIFKGQEVCYCDIMSFYLCHVAGYSFHSTIEPYKGEIFVKK